MTSHKLAKTLLAMKNRPVVIRGRGQTYSSSPLDEVQLAREIQAVQGSPNPKFKRLRFEAKAEEKEDCTVIEIC